MDRRSYEDIHAVEDKHWWFRGRRAVICALLRRARIQPSSTRTFLDVGCGTGYNLQEFAWLGSGQGAEPAASAIEFAHQRGVERVVQAEATALPFPDASFDLALAFDVLEHIDDVEAALREIRRVTTAEARLIVTVPAYRWLWSQHDDTHAHVRRYTRKMLRTQAEAAGWRMIYGTYFNSILLPSIALVRLISRGARERSDYDLTGERMNELLTIPMRLEARLIGRGIRLPAGVSFGAVLAR